MEDGTNGGAGKVVALVTGHEARVKVLVDLGPDRAGVATAAALATGAGAALAGSQVNSGRGGESQEAGEEVEAGVHFGGVGGLGVWLLVLVGGSWRCLAMVSE